MNYQRFWHLSEVIIEVSFFDVISRITPRGLSYAILSLIIEREDPVYIIVEDDDEKEVIKDILGELRDTFQARRSVASSINMRNFVVLTEEEYYLHWEDYAGKRLVFAVRDRNLKAPPMDKLAAFIEAMWRARSRDPIRRIVNHIVDILLALDVAKEHYVKLKELLEREKQETDPKEKKKLLKEVDKKRKELLGMLERRFTTRREDIDLAYELVSYLVDKGIIS